MILEDTVLSMAWDEMATMASGFSRMRMGRVAPVTTTSDKESMPGRRVLSGRGRGMVSVPDGGAIQSSSNMNFISKIRKLD
jgi:hypothetical protein